MAIEETKYSTIVIAAKHNRLSIVRNAVATTDSINTLKVRFEFRTEDWNGLVKAAIFQHANDYIQGLDEKKYMMTLDETNECSIPPEVLESRGEVLIGVFGTTGNERLTSNFLNFKLDQGCYCVGATSVELPADVYTEILLDFNKKQDNLTAGNNIVLENNVISAIIPEEYVTEDELAEELNSYLKKENAQSDIFENDVGSPNYIKNKGYTAKKYHYKFSITQYRTLYIESGDLEQVPEDSAWYDTFGQICMILFSGNQASSPVSYYSNNIAKKVYDLYNNGFIKTPFVAYTDLAKNYKICIYYSDRQRLLGIDIYNSVYSHFYLDYNADKRESSLYQYGDNWGHVVKKFKNIQDSDGYVEQFYVNKDPLEDMQIATKHYVDVAGGKIDKISVNGKELPVVDKVVDVTVPTKVSELENDEDYAKKSEIKSLIPDDIATNKYVDDKVANLVNSAPEALDTLQELSKALGDDPNFATTMATKMGEKVDKIEGKGLSSNDFTNEEKEKLDGIEVGAQVNVQADWYQNDSNAQDYIKNKTHYFLDTPAYTSDVLVTPQLGIQMLKDFSGANSAMLTNIFSYDNMINYRNFYFVRVKYELLIGSNWANNEHDIRKISNLVKIDDVNTKLALNESRGWFVYYIINTGVLTGDYINMFPKAGIYLQLTNENYVSSIRNVQSLALRTYRMNNRYLPADLAYVDEIPTKTSELINDSDFLTEQIQSDWNQNDETANDYVKNRPLHYEIYTKATQYGFVDNIQPNTLYLVQDFSMEGDNLGYLQEKLEYQHLDSKYSGIKLELINSLNIGGKISDFVVNVNMINMELIDDINYQSKSPTLRWYVILDLTKLSSENATRFTKEGIYFECTKSGVTYVKSRVLAYKKFNKNYLPSEAVLDSDLKAYAKNTYVNDELSKRVLEPENEGTVGQFLSTDGNGNRSWSDVDWNDLTNKPDIKVLDYTDSTVMMVQIVFADLEPGIYIVKSPANKGFAFYKKVKDNTEDEVTTKIALSLSIPAVSPNFMFNVTRYESDAIIAHMVNFITTGKAIALDNTYYKATDTWTYSKLDSVASNGTAPNNWKPSSTSQILYKDGSQGMWGPLPSIEKEPFMDALNVKLQNAIEQGGD